MEWNWVDEGEVYQSVLHSINSGNRSPEDAFTNIVSSSTTAEHRRIDLGMKNRDMTSATPKMIWK